MGYMRLEDVKIIKRVINIGKCANFALAVPLCEHWQGELQT